MPAVLDLFHGFCATSLVGFLVGYPVGALGVTRGWRVRFLIVGAIAGTGALALMGWPIVWAAVLGVAGAAVSVALSELCGALPAKRDPEPKPVAEPVAAPKPVAEPAAEASVKLTPGPDKTEAYGTADAEDLPLPEMSVEAAVARASRPTEATKMMAPASKWKEPAQSTSPGSVDVPDQGAWDEPGGKSTGPLPVMGKRKPGAPMDDVDLEELYDEVDAALNVVPDECPHCGGTNPADAHFCKHCSAPLKPWTCRSCGRVNDIDASFCVRCREPLQMLASPLDVEVIDE